LVNKEVNVFNNKIRNLLFLITFLILSIFVITTLAIGQRGRDLGKPAQLRAELELYKKEYLLREPIIVNMKVTNIGKEEGWLYFVKKGDVPVSHHGKITSNGSQEFLLKRKTN